MGRHIKILAQNKGNATRRVFHQKSTTNMVDVAKSRLPALAG